MKYLVDLIPLLVSDNQMFKKKSFEYSFTYNVLGVFWANFDFFLNKSERGPFFVFKNEKFEFTRETVIFDIFFEHIF
jgi:hypothetical protein